MALIDIGEGWERDLETAEKLHQNVLAQIGERGKLYRKSSAYVQLTEDLRRTLAQFGSQVCFLRDKLNNDCARLTTGERIRREGIIDSLSRKEKDLKELFSKTSFGKVNKDKQSLFRNPVPGSGLVDMGTAGWGDVESGPGAVGDLPTSSTVGGSSSQTMRERREDALADQDAGLDMLHSVILRQKNMAHQIGSEIVEQNDLIDDIDDSIDRTTQRLLENTRSVRTVGNTDKTCGYWVVILLLLIAIIVIAFV